MPKRATQPRQQGLFARDNMDQELDDALREDPGDAHARAEELPILRPVAVLWFRKKLIEARYEEAKPGALDILEPGVDNKRLVVIEESDGPHTIELYHQESEKVKVDDEFIDWLKKTGKWEKVSSPKLDFELLHAACKKDKALAKEVKAITSIESSLRGKEIIPKKRKPVTRSRRK